MNLESLTSLWLLLLAIPLIIFYFLKLKRARLKIPSLYLWSLVINDSRVNSPFQKFKKHLLLLLQLMLLIFLVLAASRPFFSGTPSKETMIPIMIDNSASMAAIDETNRVSRLDKAKEKIRSIVRNKRGDQKIALVSFSKTATKKLDFTDNSRVVLDALDQIQPEDVPSNMEDALRMVHAMSREHGFNEVILFSDGNFDEKSNFNLPFKISYRKVGEPSQNAGITGLNAKIFGENTWGVFAEVTRNNTKMPVTVEFHIDGKLATSEVIPPGTESEKITFETDGGKERLVDVKLVTDAFDALASDNSASMHLPLIRPLSVYVSDSIGSVTSSLKGIEGLRFASSPAEYVDLIVTDKEADLKSSCKTVFTNGFVPEGLRGLIEVENKPSVLVDWSNYDPLLQYAQLSELIVNSAPRIKGEAGDVEKRGFETVAFGKNGPLIVKKNWAGNISYHTLFDIEKSTLPYRVAFPVIMMNLVNLARSQAGISDSNGISTGILPELDLQANSPCEIRTPDGRIIAEKTGRSGKLSGIPALKAGKYAVSQNGELKAEISASLLSKNETMLVGIEKIEFGELSVQAEQKAIKSPRPLWKILAIAALALLILEWWVFNKPLPGMKIAGKK